MFRELMPILEGRTVMLTLARIDDATMRVCIIPKRLKEDAGENALCTPLTVTGTADELDRDFAGQLSRYTSSVVKLGSNLAEIEATHSAAVKAVEEEKKKDLDRKRGKVAGSKTTSSAAEPKPGPAIKDGKPVFGTKDGLGAAAPLTEPVRRATPDRRSGRSGTYHRGDNYIRGRSRAARPRIAVDCG